MCFLVISTKFACFLLIMFPLIESLIAHRATSGVLDRRPSNRSHFATGWPLIHSTAGSILDKHQIIHRPTKMDSLIGIRVFSQTILIVECFKFINRYIYLHQQSQVTVASIHPRGAQEGLAQERKVQSVSGFIDICPEMSIQCLNLLGLFVNLGGDFQMIFWS